MPDMNLYESRDACGAEPLAELIEAVRRDDAATRVPARIEALVLQAWDNRRHLAVERRRRTSHPVWLAALAAAVLLAALVWLPLAMLDEGADIARDTSPDSFVPPSIDSIATVDVVLDEDPASFNVVQLSVQPAVLAAFGFPVASLLDDEPVDVEVLVGLDGVPRAVRYANVVQE